MRPEKDATSGSGSSIMATPKFFEKIAVVGVGNPVFLYPSSTRFNSLILSKATGNIGQVLVSALLKTGKHTITALTRAGSKGTLPDGVKSVQVDYDNEESLVGALRGQDFLIITLAVRAPPDLHSKIVKAAAAAGVRYIMPNIYGADIRNPVQMSDALGVAAKAQLDEIESLGLSYVTLACGTWYEWSLALGDQWFGFQIKDRKVTFYDDGKTTVNVSTWDLCGRAVAALLSLPESGASPCLSDWKNEPLYIRSFASRSANVTCLTASTGSSTRRMRIGQSAMSQQPSGPRMDSRSSQGDLSRAWQRTCMRTSSSKVGKANWSTPKAWPMRCLVCQMRVWMRLPRELWKWWKAAGIPLPVLIDVADRVYHPYSSYVAVTLHSPWISIL